MKKIFVTGAAGFIGSHVAEKLLFQGAEVIGFDNLNDYYPVKNKNQNVKLLEKYKNFNFVQGDLCDAGTINDIFKRQEITHVAHLAARAGVRPSIADPKLYQKTNVEGTLNLLEAARQFPVENFVLTSSSSVYGNSKAVPFREDDSASDMPISPYAATKKATEVIAHSYHHLFGININVVRPFTVYGPRGRPDMAPWIFLSSTLNNIPIRRFGNGETRRDYTFIDDFTEGFISALKKPLGYQIFNLGNSSTVSLNEALAIVAEVCDKEQIIKEEPKQPGDVDVTYADISKAKSYLNYNPGTKFKDGMEKFYQWFKETSELN